MTKSFFGLETKNEIAFLVSSGSGKRKRKWKRKIAFPEKRKRKGKRDTRLYSKPWALITIVCIFQFFF